MQAYHFVSIRFVKICANLGHFNLFFLSKFMTLVRPISYLLYLVASILDMCCAGNLTLGIQGLVVCVVCVVHLCRNPLEWCDAEWNDALEAIVNWRPLLIGTQEAPPPPDLHGGSDLFGQVEAPRERNDALLSHLGIREGR